MSKAVLMRTITLEERCPTPTLIREFGPIALPTMSCGAMDV